MLSPRGGLPGEGSRQASTRYLIDANLLLHPLDLGNRYKREKAGKLLRILARKGNAARSTQVLSEFASVALRKLDPPFPAGKVRQQVELLAEAFPVLVLFCPVVLEALRGVERYRLSYFGAQLRALARLRGIPVILSGDFSPDTETEGVRFVNPLEPDFDLRARFAGKLYPWPARCEKTPPS